MKRAPSPWLMVLSVMVSACTSAFPPLVKATLPTSEAFPDADYVVLFDETDARYERGAKGAAELVLTERWRILVLKPTVLPSVSAQYELGSSRVERIWGRIVLPTGEVEPLDLSSRRDVDVSGGGVMATDNRVASVTVPPLPIGAVFEQEVTLRRLDVRPYLVRQGFGSTQPVQRQRLVVRAPKDWELRFAGTPGSPAPQETMTSTERVMTFEANLLPAVPVDPHAPELWTRVPTVSVRLERWTEDGRPQHAPESPEALSRWLAQHYAERAVSDEALENTVREVLSGVEDTPEAKARALYEHACRAIQYCAIEIGYGGWIPHAAKDVGTLRYGDCKDKATYLHTLMTKAGIRSAPTLIYAHRGTPAPFSLPSLAANFNHAILAVDLPSRGTVYADPTHRTVPFRQLPVSDQGAIVLELREEGAALKKTPIASAENNVLEETIELEVDAQGQASGTLTLTGTGAEAVTIKNRLVNGGALLRGWLENQTSLKQVEVREASPGEWSDFSATASVKGHVERDHVLSVSAQGDAVFRPDALLGALLTISTHRSTPYVFSAASTRTTTLGLTLPEGVSLRSERSTTTVENELLGTYRLTVKREGRRLEVVRTLVRRARVLGPPELAALGDFTESMASAERRPVLFSLLGAKR